jgi:solute:Na+ symporter, SSS family
LGKRRDVESKNYIRRDASDRHYLNVGRLATVAGVLLSIGAAYIVLNFSNIINYLQLLNGLFFVPPFAIFLIGVFWRGTTPWGGFAGLVGGVVGYLIIYALSKNGVLSLGSALGADLWQAWLGFVVATVLTVVVSLLTRDTRKSDDELRGLVWKLLDRREGYEPIWYKRPWVLATGIIAITVALNIYFF